MVSIALTKTGFFILAVEDARTPATEQAGSYELQIGADKL